VELRTFTGGGFGQNAYLAICGKDRIAVAIDPGGGAARMAEAIAAEGLELAAIVLTHAHLDHVEGIGDLRAAFPEVPIWLHPNDLGMYHALPRQAAMFGLSAEPQPDPTHELVPGRAFTFGSCSFDVRFTPGHSPGHVILVAPQDHLALVGDVVFQGSIGRTDLPGGDFHALMRSIREQVLTLPDETVLYSGHGPPTTVGHERDANPFLVPHYGGGLA
jgi:glyoxylase-like metal-dependent hydrolase (beta-lactamase superfamily II)